MDAVHGKALISLSLAGVGGFQLLDLAGSTFEPAFASKAPTGFFTNISEDPLIDPTRNILGLNTVTGNGNGALLLSASEPGGYEIIDLTASTTPAFFENTISGGVPDSSAEDCTTGIALSPLEFNAPTQVYLADLTQAHYIAGSPGTWTAPSQVQTLSESFMISSPTAAGPIAVAQGPHIGFLATEFGGNTITAFLLPATSGAVTPAITDWVSCNISGFSDGFDPHTITAYQSPNSNDAIGLLANGTATSLAVVDLTQVLNPAIVPRTVAGHGCASGTLPASVVSFVSVP
ncbi:MAG: hypothetical protein JOZ22_22525 [Acidobacteriia bacterium]|nr:hypothetical protein [Terriglobia bacterium]